MKYAIYKINEEGEASDCLGYIWDWHYMFEMYFQMMEAGVLLLVPQQQED